jgi:hypothetical protein
MDHSDALALFRAHATARLTGDTDTAERLTKLIGEGQLTSHLLFTLSLFNQFTIEELGDRPDPEDLAAFTKRLHDKHVRPGHHFNALRAEAMIRAVCGESHLLAEIPHREQTAYMWAVIDELAEPDLTETELAERFDLAEVSRAGWAATAIESPLFGPMPPHQSAPQSGPTETTADDLEPGSSTTATEGAAQ